MEVDRRKGYTVRAMGFIASVNGSKVYVIFVQTNNTDTVGDTGEGTKYKKMSWG